MAKIEINTTIHAHIDICFDLARSIDLHKISTPGTKEAAIAGRTHGLIEFNEFVTWQATHFGIRQQLTSKITAFDKPYFFVDEQIKGPFKSLYHEHKFEQMGNKTIMTDRFEFEAPLGILGKLFNAVILTSYMTRFLTDRNNIIKEFAETNKWKSVLEESTYLPTIVCNPLQPR